MLDSPNLDHQTYQVDGKTYRVTGAVYNLAMNHHDGALIIVREYSPKNQAAVRNPPVPDDQLPRLRAASDIIWIEWAARAGSADAAKNLKTVTIYRVSNEMTTAAIRRALDSRNTQLSAFPGEQFDATSDEGKALIGSPNGVGVGYLLLQHKPQLGNLKISKIDVFSTIHDGYAWEAVLIFHIEAT
ncbi:hypothetical protein BCR34DRAFT_205657 [Clohesyomyces aquaticus]|uniref:Uncharacterized protein n=1 Tax=Clohesyomyces aquaticus TaxID=1231657 RepID=A0A1Y1YB21_9PLEO|nr:hypothetical protein BCR34DRAFT_205657 [Clohesyomyces aquaticus]